MANETVNRYLNVYIQSGDAQKVYDRLIAKQKTLNEQLAGNPKNADKLRQELARLEEPISRAAKKLSGELSPSLKDTQATARRLGDTLKKMSTEDANYSTVLAQYKQASTELDTQRTKLGLLNNAMRSFWQEAKTVAVGVLIGNSIQAALSKAAQFVTQVVEGAAKISDELTAIEKTSGLTTEQVREVNAELSKMDTRTSRSELRQLAVEAGKLGKESVEDVKKFVDEADKIKVALGQDLGENAIIDIAKTAGIFKEEMLNIASAINEIGANSAASEAFSVEFLKRMAGTAPTVKLAADEVLGYSAALEIAGQTTEVSSTALNTFFLDFVSNSEKFGKAAGFTKGQLTDLINVEGTNEAFLQFLEGLKQAEPTAAGFINKLKELGIDGARGSNVMLALSNNIETVRKQQQIANTAIQSNSSIMTEFNKQNNNAAGALAKLKKEISGIFESNTFQAAGEGIIMVLVRFVGVIKVIPKFIRENETALSLLVLGVLLLNASYIKAAASITLATLAQARDVIVKKATTVWTTLVIAGQLAYAYAAEYLAGRITLATFAQRIWNVAVSFGAGPLGILLVAISAVAIAIGTMIGNTKKLTTEQKLQAEISAKVAESTTKEVEAVRQMEAILKSTNVTLEDKRKVIDKLIAQSPETLKGLTLENIATEEGRLILDKYIASLREKARVAAQSRLLDEKLEQREQAALDQGKVEKRLPTTVLGSIVPSIKEFAGSFAGGVYNDYNEAIVKVNELDEEISILQKSVDANNIKNVQSISKTGDAIVSTTTKVEGLGKAAKKGTDDIAKLIEELQQIAFSLLPDGADKDVLKLQQKYDALAARAGTNNKLLIEIQRLYEIELQALVDDYAQKAITADRKRSADQLKEEEARRKAAVDRIKVLTTSGLEGLGKTINTDRIAQRELDVLQRSGKARLNAELALLKEQERQELLKTELTEIQKNLIREQYRQKREELETKSFFGEVEKIMAYAQQALNVLNIIDQGKAEKENAELERDRQLNEKKKRNLDNRLKAGTISQAHYDREVQRLEKAQEKREKETREKQFKRSQRMQIVQAIMNGAMAVTSTLAAIPGPLDIATLGAARIIQIGLAVATTAAQVATIAKQKPPAYAKGGKLTGPSHQDKSQGMPVMNPYTNQVQAYVEGGEAVVNKRTMADTRKYKMEGTPSQIISWLNASKGGVHWESGAKVLAPAWKTYRAPAMDFPKIKKYYAEGGVMGSAAKTAAPAVPAQDNNTAAAITMLTVAVENLMITNVNMQQTIDNMQSTLAKGITAYTLITDQERQQARLNSIREDATMRG